MVEEMCHWQLGTEVVEDERVLFDLRDLAQMIGRGGYKGCVADEESESIRRPALPLTCPFSWEAQ